MSLMKRFLVFCTVFAVAISGCNLLKQKEAPPLVIEGRVAGTAIYTSRDDKTETASIVVQDSIGRYYEGAISVNEAEKIRKSVNVNYPGYSPLYARLVKGGDKTFTFSFKEFAVMNYDHGTPPCYTFPSDDKIVAFYKP